MYAVRAARYASAISATRRASVTDLPIIGSEYLPSNARDRLAISMWDLSWAVRGLPGEAFADYDVAFREAQQRGFNALRIEALPTLAFDLDGNERHGVHVGSLGGGLGVRTRWYDLGPSRRIDPLARFMDLLRSAQRHDFVVIITSATFQQMTSFILDRAIVEDLRAVKPLERFRVQADAVDRLVGAIRDAGLLDTVAYVEFHNEVDLSRLAEIAESGESVQAALKPQLELALDRLRQRHPDVLWTVSYGEQKLHRMGELAQNVQVAHHHLYVYGVLLELERFIGLYPEFRVVAEGQDPPPDAGEFPPSVAASMFRSDAPPFATWRLPDEDAWKLDLNFLDRRLFYVHDWVDPDRWDRWLYDHWSEHRVAMLDAIELRLTAIADWAASHNVPAVIGEGWVGYTPRDAEFEGGPIGRGIVEYGVLRALELGYWGIVTMSNAAPHHPEWRNVNWLHKVNSAFRNGDVDALDRLRNEGEA